MAYTQHILRNSPDNKKLYLCPQTEPYTLILDTCTKNQVDSKQLIHRRYTHDFWCWIRYEGREYIQMNISRWSDPEYCANFCCSKQISGYFVWWRVERLCTVHQVPFLPLISCLIWTGGWSAWSPKTENCENSGTAGESNPVLLLNLSIEVMTVIESSCAPYTRSLSFLQVTPGYGPQFCILKC
jgi:hypothetical protein